jgi:hypothetical protein
MIINVHVTIDQDTGQGDKTTELRMQDQSVKAYLTEAGFHGHDFVADIPDLARPSSQIHGPGFIDSDPPKAEFVQAMENLPGNAGNFISRVMIFFIGHVAGLALNIFPIMDFDQGNSAPCTGIDA